MKINSIVNRFILSELIPPFVMNLLFFMFVFLMRQILEITNLIVNYRVSVAAFFLMIAYSMPYFLVYIIPMSVMMSVLLTFLRMSADNEIVALKAGGVSLYGMLPPVMAFGLAGFLLTVFMAVYGMPWGKTAYGQLTLDVIRSNFSLGLKEQQFNDSFDGVMFYVNDIDMKSRKLHDVFIEDSRKSGITSTVVAPEGYLFGQETPHTMVVRLYNGLISQVQLDKRSAHAIRFDTYDIRLDLKSAVSAFKDRTKDEKEMGLGELMHYLETAEAKDKRYYSILIELHRKFSIPFACIALAVLAMPLGVRTISARKSAGLGVGLMCFLLYYILLSSGMVFGETGRFHPAIGLWAPNVIMGGLGLYMFGKTANDRPIMLFSIFRYARHELSRLLMRITGRRHGAETSDWNG